MNHDEMVEKIKSAPFIYFEDDTVTIPKKEYEELLKAKGKAEILENLLEKIDYFNFKE